MSTIDNATLDDYERHLRTGGMLSRQESLDLIAALRFTGRERDELCDIIDRMLHEARGRVTAPRPEPGP